jgi:intracellular sulfur oxidation DsrE/DsrF family protein
MHWARMSLATMLMVFAVATAWAEQPRVVLQLTDASVEKHTLVLNVAENLLEHYGDDIEVEVVAFGPGLKMLFADSGSAERIERLAAKGVRFAACRNTHRKMTKLAGEEVPLAAQVSEVEGGAARIVELVQQGYVLLRP